MAQITKIILDFDFKENFVLMISDFLTSQKVRNFVGCKYDSIKKLWKFSIDYLELFQQEFGKSYDIQITENLFNAYNNFINTKNTLKHFKTDKISDEEIENTMFLKLNGKSLKEEQIQGAKWLIGIKKGILAFGTGVGKTFTALEACFRLFNQGKSKKFLIITLSQLTSQWVNEIKNNFPKAYIFNANVQGEKRKEIYDNFMLASEENLPTFLVTNIEKIRLDLNEYLKMNFNVVVIDEASKIKSTSTHTGSKIAGKFKKNNRISVQDLCKKAEYVFALTATPVETSYYNLFGIFNVINENLFSGGLYRFRQRYFIEDFFGNFTKENKANVEELRNFISMYIFSKKVKLDVDTKVEKILLDFSAKDLENYELIRTQTLNKFGIDETDINNFESILSERKRKETALEIFGKRMQFIDFPSIVFQEKYGDIYSPKMSWVLKNIKKLSGKTIIFDSRVMTTEKIRKAFNENKIEYFYIDGSLSSKQKDKVIDNFEKSKEVNVLICTDSLAYGKNLQFAQNMIFFNLAYNPGTLSQRSGRIIRRGQNNQVKIYVLIMKDTVEEKIYNRLGDRINNAENVLSLKNKKMDLISMIEEK